MRPDSQKPATLFGIPVTTKRVLIVWHEDQMIDIDASKQESMARKELADFILALPSQMSVNVLLALGNVTTPGEDAKDDWLLKEPMTADAQIKKQILEALDPETRSKQFAEGTLSNALRAALEASDGHESTVIVVRLRDDSQIEGPLDASLSDKRAGVTLHAVVSRESPTLATLVRNYRGSMIVLESDGDFVFGKVQKRVIDATKD